MNIFKAIIKKRGSLIWFIVSVTLIVILTTVTILSTTILYELFGQIMPGGPERAIYAEGINPIYLSEYKDKNEVYDAAQKFNIELSREGIVLLKNDGNSLPIYTPESPVGKQTAQKPKISVFGKSSESIAYGGSGSGGVNDTNAVSLYAALEGAGYELNPELKSFYQSTSRSGEGRSTNPSNLDRGDTVVLYTGETPQSRYEPSVRQSYANYNDVALIVFTRIGGEGFDLPRSMKGAQGAKNEDDHFLQLDANELDLLDAVCGAGFQKVVILLNSGSTMQLNFLNEPAYSDIIDAAIWMGYPGETGTVALGEILNGSTNPSGRTPDTYATDFKKNPTWNNFGDNRITSDADNGVLGGDQYMMSDTAQLYYFVDYEESVYVGYKYYETRAAYPQSSDSTTWYKDNVIYPFGHGLSYTTFSWEIDNKSAIENKTIEKGSKYTISIKVTNTGSVAGKDVVQLYGNAPYTVGEIEKPYVTLLDFAKTDLIEPGKDRSVELTFDPYYLASYDYKDQNKNTFKGYELDAGDDYNLFVSANAHDAKFTIPFRSTNIQFDKDPVTNQPVTNKYTDQSTYYNSDTQLSTLLSRSNWNATWPTGPCPPYISLDDKDERLVDNAFINALKDISHNNPTKFGSIEMPYTEEDNGLTLRDLLFDDEGNPYQTKNEIPYIDYSDALWDDLLNQASVSEMKTVYNYGAYQTRAITSIGLPRSNCADGPVGWTSFMNKVTFYGTCSYTAQVVVAATFNKQLAEEFGKMIGDEGIIGNYKGDKMPYSGWYAPGVNIHRSPFGGRNFEYYSEDGVLSGKMAAAQIRGAQSKGVFCFIKHFALNEQETHRSIGGNCSWVTEQAMREIYFRPFEIAVKEGGTRAIMSSFNRIGTRWTGGDYRLITGILRNEWGFRGAVICDFNTVPQYMNSKQMAYAGGDLNLSTTPVNWCNESSAADVYILRQCVKNIAYMVGNSNAMNGEIIGYNMPIWQIFLVIIDCVIVAGLAAWGFFAIRGALKKSKLSN